MFAPPSDALRPNPCRLPAKPAINSIIIIYHMSLLADTCWVEPPRHATVSNEFNYQFYAVKCQSKKCHVHLKHYFIVLVTFQKYNRTLLTYVFPRKIASRAKKVLLYYKIWAHQHKMTLGFAQLLPKLHPKWQGYLDFMFFIQSGFKLWLSYLGHIA